MGQQQEVDIDDIVANVMERRNPIDPKAKGRIRKPQDQRKLNSTLVVIASIVVGIFILGFVAYKLLTRSSTSVVFPNNIKDSVSYDLYYPSSLPSGYSLDTSSMKIEQGVVSFAVNTVGQNIFINEQPLPSEFGSFKIDGFDSVVTASGTLLVGVALDTPTAILTTDNTLITIKGSTDVSKETITEIGQRMARVFDADTRK